jgi:hypothetical protein
VEDDEPFRAVARSTVSVTHWPSRKKLAWYAMTMGLLLGESLYNTLFDD